MILEKWVDRTFDFTLPPSRFHPLLERLRGTPVRLEDRTRRLPADVLTRHDGEGWSIQENVGHLLDLEPLWLRRAEQLFEGRPELVAADMTNQRTREANHNEGSLPALLEGFRTARDSLVRRLEESDEAAIVRSALHPRLRTPMRLIDLVLFVAEHDDHHLATISEMRRRWNVP